MSLVCFDTHIFIWGFKGESTVGQEQMIPKARRFIQDLDEAKDKIMVPAPVFAEVFMAIPEGQHTLFTNLCERTFVICPFDARAAQVAAKLWREGPGAHPPAKPGQQPPVPREVLKVDCMIVACAIAHGADYIVSYDDHLVNIAGGHIEVRQIQERAREQVLFKPEKVQ